jgi:hypothetical protein
VRHALRLSYQLEERLREILDVSLLGPDRESEVAEALATLDAVVGQHGPVHE